MRTYAIVVATFLLAGSGAFAGYVEEREAAAKMPDQEALSAFIKLADTAASDRQREDALGEAALRASRLKDHAQAMELAVRMPPGPAAKCCQMQLLMQAGKSADLLARFKGEDIDHWPESLRGKAFLARGTAAYLVKDGDLAVVDLGKAADYLSDTGTQRGKAMALITLGDGYARLLNDRERALAAYRRVYVLAETDGNYDKLRFALSAATSLLLKEGKTGEAVAEFEKVDIGKAPGVYRADLLAMLGKTLVAAGMRDKAVTKYQEALGVKEISDATKTACGKAITELGSGAKD